MYFSLIFCQKLKLATLVTHEVKHSSEICNTLAQPDTYENHFSTINLKHMISTEYKRWKQRPISHRYSQNHNNSRKNSYAKIVLFCYFPFSSISRNLWSEKLWFTPQVVKKRSNNEHDWTPVNQIEYVTLKLT